MLMYGIHDEVERSCSKVVTQKKPNIKKPVKGSNHSIMDDYFMWKHGTEKFENSFVNQAFEGDMVCVIECHSCRKRSRYFEKFGDLTLDLTNTVSTQELYKNRKLLN